jgi:peptidoglycan/LPS O-acetylase OafA/YrhL
MLAESLRAGTPVELASVLNSITFIPVFDDDTYSWPLHYLGWTLAFEFVFYLVVAALIAGGRQGRHATLLVATLSLPLVGFVVQSPLTLWKVLTNPIIWEFALGIVACMLWEKRWLERLRVPFAVAVGAALIAAAIAVRLLPEELLRLGDAPVEGASTTARAFWWGIPAFSFFCLIVGLPSAGDGRIARLLKLLGDASYSIYLSHLFVIMFMGVVIKHLPLHPDWVVLATMALSAAVGIAVFRLFEKPMLTAGQRRIRSWSMRHMHSGAGIPASAERQAPG